MAAAATNAKTQEAPAAANRIALVSGANKGIGYAIVEALAKDTKLTVLLGARDAKRGEEAVKQLGKANVHALALDVDNHKSIESAAAEVKQKFGGLDILINNAGIAWKGDAFDETVARTTIHTNYYGVKHMLHAFLPLIKQNGRVVNVSSMVAPRTMGKLPQSLRDKFLAANLTESELDGLMESFIKDVKENKWQQNGWPKTTYGMSKVGCSMLTRITARENKRADVLINCCCPGWVRTDMAGPKAEKSPEEGAVTPVYLALLPAGSPTGKFWEDKEISEWVEMPQQQAK